MINLEQGYVQLTGLDEDLPMMGDERCGQPDRARRAIDRLFRSVNDRQNPAATTTSRPSDGPGTAGAAP